MKPNHIISQPLLAFAGMVALSVNTVSATPHYVDVNGTNATPPYLEWSKAATNIQDAVDAASDGDEVVVTNGIYATGGRAVYGLMTNRVAVDKPITLSSVNGPQFTFIQGYQRPDTTNGVGAIRCVYLTNGASLIGFTLTNGATQIVGDYNREQCGGGLWCEPTSAVASNCVLTANSAYKQGGGAIYGTLNNCTVTGNSASQWGGGVSGHESGPFCTLNNCTLTGNSANYGGGAAYSTLNNCTLSTNFAEVGGAAFVSTPSNCTLTGNRAVSQGGGVSGSTLTNCTLVGNSVTGGSGAGGGAFQCIIYNCSLSSNSSSGYGGGGSDNYWIYNSTLTGNWAKNGGGVYGGKFYNCVFTGNWATNKGGGAYGATLYNCVLTGNGAGSGGGAHSSALYCCTAVGNWATTNGGGVVRVTTAGIVEVYNSIVYYNTSLGTAPNYDGAMTSVGYSCMPNSGGKFSITNEPLFLDLAGGNLRLQSNSPCINGGYAGSQYDYYVQTTTDLDGSPRIVGGTVDMGVYECQSPALLDYYTWLQGYGLPTTASTIYADSDGDHMNNWQEWRCLTNPTNASSVLQMLAPTGDVSGVTVSWQSVTNRTYWLERATDLASLPPFSGLASNIAGQLGTTTYTDTTATNGGPFFYRVGVQP